MDRTIAQALWSSIEQHLDAHPLRPPLQNWRKEGANEARERSRLWSDAEIFEGLVCAVLSSSTNWATVQSIRSLLNAQFQGFELDWYAARPDSYVHQTLEPWFKSNRAGSPVLRGGLKRLIKAAKRLTEHRTEHGTLDAYFNALVDQHGHDPKLVAIALGSGDYGRPDRLPGLGLPLAAEFLKNIGFDIAKPDRHINRAIGCFGWVKFKTWPDRSGTKAPVAKESELREVMQVMEDWTNCLEDGLRIPFVDHALWLLCAKSGLHLSNAELAALARDSGCGDLSNVEGAVPVGT